MYAGKGREDNKVGLHIVSSSSMGVSSIRDRVLIPISTQTNGPDGARVLELIALGSVILSIGVSARPGTPHPITPIQQIVKHHMIGFEEILSSRG